MSIMQFPFDSKFLSEVLYCEEVLKKARELLLPEQVVLLQGVIDSYKMKSATDILREDEALAKKLRKEVDFLYEQFVLKQAGWPIDDLVKSWADRAKSSEFGHQRSYGHYIFCKELGINTGGYYSIKPGCYEKVKPDRWEELALLLRGIYWTLDSEAHSISWGN